MQDSFSSLIVFSVINQFTPGPNNLMAMANSAQYGIRKTFRFTLGVSCANGVLLMLGCLFQHSLHRIMPGIEPWMNALIFLYMIYLAWKILNVQFEGRGDRVDGNLNSIKVGFFLQFLNPKLIMFCVAVSGGFLLPLYGDNMSLLTWVILLLSCSAMLANNMWALFGEVINKWLSKWQKVMNWVMALLVLWCASQFVS